MEDFQDVGFIEWDSDSQMWSEITVPEFMEQQLEAEKQYAQENDTFPKLQKISKKPAPKTKEQWDCQRVNEHVAILSNTKFVREAFTQGNLPPRTYVIVPVNEYQCFRRGAKDFGFGSQAVLLINPDQCPVSMAEFGRCLNEQFGMQFCADQGVN